jgi:hypothetical protein
MSWILMSLVAFGMFSLVTSIIVYLRRTHKQKHMDLRFEAWSKHCQTTDAEDNILVIITTAQRTSRDVANEILPTLNGLFERAHCPHRLRVGIVTRKGALDTVSTLFPEGDGQREAHPYASRFVNQVRVCGPRTMLGPSPARAIALKELAPIRERFVMFIHSRAVFAPNWDQRLVHDISMVDGPVAVTALLKEASLTAGDGSAPSVIAAIDMDDDSFPILVPRPFARSTPTALPRATLFASPSMVFVKTKDIQGSSNLLGSTALAYVHGDLDAFALTLALRLNGFKMLAPSHPVATHLRMGSSTVSLKKWKVRLGVLSLQGLVAALIADQALQRATSIGTDGALLTAVAGGVQWALPAFGASFLLPGTKSAMQAAMGRNEPDAPGSLALTAIANKTISNAKEIIEGGPETHVVRVLEASETVRNTRAKHLFPGSEKWIAVLRTLIDANSSAVHEWIASGGDVVQVMEDIGVDIRTGHMAGRTVLGMEDRKHTDQEILERFGSTAAYKRERSRWTFA